MVVSSHDYADNPTFEPLNKNTHLVRRPTSALSEGITRYLPRYLPTLGTRGTVGEPDRFEEPTEKKIQQGLGDLTAFLKLARTSSANVMVLQHWEKSELERGRPNHHGYQCIRQVCESVSVSCISLEPLFSQAVKDGKNPYRDNIHPNQTGQKLITDALFENLTDTARH